MSTVDATWVSRLHSATAIRSNANLFRMCMIVRTSRLLLCRYVGPYLRVVRRLICVSDGILFRAGFFQDSQLQGGNVGVGRSRIMLHVEPMRSGYWGCSAGCSFEPANSLPRFYSTLTFTRSDNRPSRLQWYIVRSISLTHSVLHIADQTFLLGLILNALGAC